MWDNEPFKNTKLAVLSESRMMLSLIRDMLHGSGLRQPILLTDQSRLLEMLEAHFVDCLILDMPVTATSNPFKFSFELRHNQGMQNAFMPIILLSDYTTRGLTNQAINFGIDSVILKPLSAQTLFKRMEIIVHEPRTYIRTAEGYFGPDRRRQQDPHYFGEDRREQSVAKRFEPGVRDSGEAHALEKQFQRQQSQTPRDNVPTPKQPQVWDEYNAFIIND